MTDSVGTEIASYTYDAFNRRIAKTAGGLTEETAWAGWQPLERYEAGQLAERRTYGAGLDEVVRIESDLDGDGTLDQSYTPVYDHTGNLALVTDSTTGQVIERYRLTPYGERTILVDSTPPAVEQLRVKDGALWLEISEGVNAEALQAAVTAGAVTLTETATSTDITLTPTQPVQEGGQAFRRIVLTPDTAPADGTTLELRLEPAALVDAFGNQLAATYLQGFDWPAGDEVVDDTAAPTVEAVRLVDRFVEIELSEEPDLATVEAAVTVDGAQLTWTLGADRYTVRSSEALDAGASTLSVGTTLADLSGTTLAGPLAEAVPATVPDLALFEAPDPRVTVGSTVGNRAGFQGHDHDPDTGLVYVRNRWLDPQFGRFVSADPLSFVDGPNEYAFVAGKPLDAQDPLGLYQEDFHFYAVYYMALLALDYDLERAWKIAYASQFVDDSPLSGPFPSLEDSLTLFRHSDKYFEELRDLHFPAAEGMKTIRATEDPEGQAFYLIDRAIESGSEVQLGVALHTFADSFAHEGFSAEVNPENSCRNFLSWLPGHGECWEHPDQPYEDPDKAAEAALAIYDQIRRFGEAQGLVSGSGGLSSIERRKLQETLRGMFHSYQGSLGRRTTDWAVYLSSNVLRGYMYRYDSDPSSLSPKWLAKYVGDNFEADFRRAIRRQRQWAEDFRRARSIDNR